MKDGTGRRWKGSMPFAMAAVAILLLSSAYGVAIASVNDTTENTRTMTAEIMSVSEAVADTGRYIEAGIGRIINDITADEDGGTLIDRMDSFQVRLDSWIGSSFPLTDRGTTVDVTGHDISLSVENMKGTGKEGTSPSFLRASGTVGLSYNNSAGCNERTISISADGTSGLPFVVESMTRFELSASGCASALTDLMTYQLSSLAQTRAMNGYGSVSEYGEKGTVSIITEGDVMESLRTSLFILEELCFRTNGDLDMSVEHVDAAELLISEDGIVTMDMSFIMSQALIAAGDQIVGKWFDMMWGSELLDALDAGMDGIRVVIRSVQELFSGDDRGSAVPYIVSAMGSNGHTEDDYRYVKPAPAVISIGGTFRIDDDWYGFRDKDVIVEDFDVVLDLPATDILGWDGWNDFVKRYESGRNELRESIRTAIHTAAIECMDGRGTLRIEADPFDDETFLSSVSKAFDTAFQDGLERLKDDLAHTVDVSTVPDPVYQVICDDIRSNRDAVFGTEGLRERAIGHLRERIAEHLRTEGRSDIGGRVTDLLLGSAVSSEGFSSWIDSCERAADERTELICGTLSKVRKDNDGMVKEAMRYVMERSLETDFVKDVLYTSTKGMISDMTGFHRINTLSKVIDLDTEEGFVLTDAEGRTSFERFRVDDSVDMDIRIIAPKDNRDKCSHTVDADYVVMSPYTSVFTVELRGNIGYMIESRDIVMERLDWYDCAAKGCIGIDTSLDIPFVTGWALAGVYYPPTQYITDELWEHYGHILRPLMGPLTDLYEALKGIYDICRNALVEVSAYLEELIMRIYETITEPLERLQEELEDGVLKAISDVVTGFDIGLGSQSFTVSYMGMSITLETRLATLTSATKSICKVTLKNRIGDTDVTVSLELKENKTHGLMIKGSGEVKGDGWKLKLTLDPFMRFSKRVLKVMGTVRDVDFSISVPEIEQYDEMELKVSDIPGVGELLSNIPLPIPDVKGSVDMGLFLRYDMPFRSALVINEFESNPAGTDRGNEWVEIYNGTMSKIDLTGYVLSPGSDESKSIVLSGEIGPLGRKVFTFDHQALNNSAGKRKGECLTLYDPEGNEVDSTPWKSDSHNDGRTWQRSTDGGKTWQFSKGTKGKSNGTSLGVDSFTKTFIVDSLIEAGETALYEMGNHLRSVDDIEEFLKRMVALFIENVIQKVADVIIAAGVFIVLEVTDYAETMHSGIRVSLEMNSELVSDGLRWLLSQIDVLSEYVKAPRSTDPLDIVCDDVYLRTTAYCTASAPKILSKGTDIQIQMGISSAVNISGLCTLFGKERGIWKAEIGLIILDCPFELMPKRMKETEGSKGDLWLLRMSFERSV